ncbi:THO complex subunit 5B-like protein [Drosera capensis]
MSTAMEEHAAAAAVASEKIPSPYDVLKDSKASMEEIVAQMLSIKRGQNPKSQLRELLTQSLLHFFALRQANRSILMEEDRIKAETESAKAPVDFTTLQLHNLMYEKNHYVKAIKACTDFKSKYPDIELVPEEEFFRAAPKYIKEDATPDDNAHSLMLKRLNFELYQRKELCKLREQLEERKKKLSQTIATRKKFLSSLPSHLKSLRKASIPVQQELGVHHTKKLKQHTSAELLPPALYIIYSQFMAQKEAFGEHIDLEITGSLKDAQAFVRQQSNKDTGASTNQESARLEDDLPEEEDDDQRRRKRPKKVPGKDNHDQAGIYQAHPLRVILHCYDHSISHPKPVKLVTLKFEYLLRLNVVCVGIEGSGEGTDSSVLCNLFPDDTGLELPHQSAKLSLGERVVFDETRSSRPYKWAQHLAGLDFLPEVSPLLMGSESQGNGSIRTAVISGLQLYREQNRTQTIVERVRSRVKSQLALVEQLDQLRKLKWPSLTCESIPWASHKPLCTLQSWSALGSSSEVGMPLLETNANQAQYSSVINVMDARRDATKEIPGFVGEDGELPALLPTPAATDNNKVTLREGSDREHSRGLAMMSKITVSPYKVAKTQSFRIQDEDSELMLMDSESDHEESGKTELEAVSAADIDSMDAKSWVDYKVEEFRLVLASKMSENGNDVKLEARVKISVEYPVRPPLWAVDLLFPSSGEKNDENGTSFWFNELRAMEAEVNLHILKMLPFDEQNQILAHQARCLSMLFDFYMAEVSEPYEKRKSTSVIDIGLCNPINGTMLARSFRGRDRRKMLSWKNLDCSPGFPY